MKTCTVLMHAALLLASCGSVFAQTSPAALTLTAGTAIPITFPRTLDASKLRAGDMVTVRTDQVIVASLGERVPRSSKLTGTVVKAYSSGASNDPSELAVKFDTLNVREQAFPIHVALRALASFVLSYGRASPAADYGSLESDLQFESLLRVGSQQ